MNAAALIRAGRAETCHPWFRRTLTQAAWRQLADALAADKLPLLGLWADTVQVHALFLDGKEPLLASVDVDAGVYPALSPVRPAAAWFERAIHDLFGHAPEGGTDLRPWLDHGRWPQERPMSPRPVPGPATPEPPEFLPVTGDDLHQIGVGPVHAGIIEPGHFRFTASGETVVRLETRLGYAHKGTQLLVRGKSPRAAARFVARLSGDSTVAHAIAFARAAEAALGKDAPPRAAALRVVMGEIERLANHFGDIGAICGDAAFAMLQGRFGLHRECLLRATHVAFGHRLMMDAVVPGGVVADLAPGGAETLFAVLDAAEAELPELIRIYEDSPTLADRMMGTGIVPPALAGRLAAGGVVGRASGRDFDARRLLPDYAEFGLTVPVLRAGDVDARIRVRFAEIVESLRVLRAMLPSLPDGLLSVALPQVSGEGVGVAEGFRGDVWHWLRLDGGMIAAAFARDPSWLHWPLLESAIEGNIVADFPLINKSFNGSYSGVDL